jgi:hypothetical protein
VDEMVGNNFSSEGLLKTYSSYFGSAFEALCEVDKTKTHGKIHLAEFEKYFPKGDDSAKSLILGALNVFYIMGILVIDSDGYVRTTSREAHFALRSLSKYLKASTPIVNEPVSEDEKQYLVQLTKSFETMRTEERLGKSPLPLHSRRIVNVLIKGRQLRGARYKDVFLHVYHPKWEEYHLVGLSHKDDSKTDEELVALAMQQQVGLNADQYIMDSMINPKEVTAELISATNGVLTQYTISLKVVKKIKIALKLKKWVNDGKFDKNWFRWFTWDEIQQRESGRGERIMFSTSLMMSKLDLDPIPVSTVKADDARLYSGIVSELGCRLSYRQLFFFFVILLVILALPFLQSLLNWLNIHNKLLRDLADAANIIQLVLTILMLLYALRTGSQK